MLNNRYFEVDHEVWWFEARGWSWSNHWIGRSRCGQTQWVGQRAPQGTIFHSLVGGLFVQSPDGQIRSGAMKAKITSFEKNYGLIETDTSILEALAKMGIVSEIPKPDGNIDYRSATKARDDNQLPDLSPGILVRGHSPEYVEFGAELSGLKEAVEEHGGEFKLYEMLTERRVKAIATIPGKKPVELTFHDVSRTCSIVGPGSFAPAEIVAVADPKVISISDDRFHALLQPDVSINDVAGQIAIAIDRAHEAAPAPSM